MKHLKTFEAHKKFYSSNFDKWVLPDEPGWYVQYTNYSGDESFIEVDREPKTIKDAHNMVEDIISDYDKLSHVKFYKYVSQRYISI